MTWWVASLVWVADGILIGLGIFDHSIPQWGIEVALGGICAGLALRPVRR